MNIAFLLRLWPVFGGGETITISLSNEFVKRGYGVSVLYFRYTNSEKALSIDHRVHTIEVPGINCDDKYANESDSLAVSKFLINYIKENKIDIVINQWWPLSYIKDIKVQTQCIVIRCYHTAFFHPDFSTGIKKLVKTIFKNSYLKSLRKDACKEVESFLPYVDKYVFLSPRFVNQFEEFGGDNSDDKVCAIPNPLTYINYIKQDKIKDKSNNVVFVGRISDSIKRLSISLNAWAFIEKDETLKSWSFYVIGDGPDLLLLKQKVASLGLKRVYFEGFQNPEVYYKNARILVQNSKYEGFGMTIIEAQQNGCVPVAMDTFLTVHDLIKSGYNGLITKDDPDSFTENLVSLMKDDELLNKMANNAICTSKEFGVDKIVDKWEELFHSIKTETI